MKNLNDYILEKANFLVKKHIKNIYKPGDTCVINNIDCVYMGYDEDFKKDIYLSYPIVNDDDSDLSIKTNTTATRPSTFSSDTIQQLQLPDGFEIPNASDSFIKKLATDENYLNLYKDNVYKTYSEKWRQNYCLAFMLLSDNNSDATMCFVENPHHGSRLFKAAKKCAIALVLYTTK